MSFQDSIGIVWNESSISLSTLLHSRERGISSTWQQNLDRKLHHTFVTQHLAAQGSSQLTESRQCHVMPYELLRSSDSIRSTLCMSISGDARYLASGQGDHSIRIFDLFTLRCVQTLIGHQRTVFSLDFHPTDPNILVSCCWGGDIRVWAITTNTSDTDNPPLSQHRTGDGDSSIHDVKPFIRTLELQPGPSSALSTDELSHTADTDPVIVERGISGRYGSRFKYENIGDGEYPFGNHPNRILHNTKSAHGKVLTPRMTALLAILRCYLQVMCVKFSPCGKYITVSCMRNLFLWRWEGPTGDAIADEGWCGKLRHKDQVYSIEGISSSVIYHHRSIKFFLWTKDGATLLVFTSDGEAQVPSEIVTSKDDDGRVEGWDYYQIFKHASLEAGAYLRESSPEQDNQDYSSSGLGLDQVRDGTPINFYTPLDKIDAINQQNGVRRLKTDNGLRVFAVPLQALLPQMRHSSTIQSEYRKSLRVPSRLAKYSPFLNSYRTLLPEVSGYSVGSCQLKTSYDACGKEITTFQCCAILYTTPRRKITTPKRTTDDDLSDKLENLDIAEMPASPVSDQTTSESCYSHRRILDSKNTPIPVSERFPTGAGAAAMTFGRPFLASFDVTDALSQLAKESNSNGTWKIRISKTPEVAHRVKLDLFTSLYDEESTQIGIRRRSRNDEISGAINVQNITIPIPRLLKSHPVSTAEMIGLVSIRLCPMNRFLLCGYTSQVGDTGDDLLSQRDSASIQLYDTMLGDTSPEHQLKLVTQLSLDIPSVNIAMWHPLPAHGIFACSQGGSISYFHHRFPSHALSAS